MSGTVWGILILLITQSAVAGDYCVDLFSLKAFQESEETVTIQDQVRFVREFEQDVLKSDSEAVVTDYNFLLKLLQTYVETKDEAVNGLKSYSQSNLDLDSAVQEYLTARIKLLTPEQAEETGKVIRSLSWTDTKTLGADSEDDMTAAYIPQTKTIHLEMPPKYKDSLIQWFLFFHEMEHAIQHTKLLTSFSDHNHKVSGKASNEIEYLSEQGAMTAEWIFLQAIPDEVIQKTISQIKVAKDISPTYKKFFLRAFQNSRLPLQQYLEGEHQANRYSRESM